MEEYKKRIEKDLAVPNLPQYKSKEEIIEHARQRLVAKRNRSTGGAVQGDANSGGVAEDTVRRDKGNSGGSAGYSAGNGNEGRPQTQPVYAGDGRDALGTRGANGYFGDTPIGNRVDASSGTGASEYNGSASRTSEPEVHAPARKGSRGVGGGFRSKLKTYASTAFAPIKEESPPSKVTTARRGGAAAPAKSGKWRPLTEGEANSLHPKLIQYITWQSEHLDQFIIATVKGHDPTIEIWADLDEAEIEILADYLIQRGRRDGTTAQAVRYAADILDRIKVAVIVLPRVYRTVNLYLARGLDINIFIRPQR